MIWFVVAVIVAAILVLNFYATDIALLLTKAEPIDLWDAFVVDGCRVLGLERPLPMFKYKSDSHNAFCTDGRRPALFVSSALIRDMPEIEGVIAHEMGHLYYNHAPILAAMRIATIFVPVLFSFCFSFEVALFAFVLLWLLGRRLRVVVEYEADRVAIECGRSIEVVALLVLKNRPHRDVERVRRLCHAVPTGELHGATA